MLKRTFIFDSYLFDRQAQTIIFNYAIVSDSETVNFQEKIELPLPIDEHIPDQLIEIISFQLHIMLGISYYKLYCPQVIQIDSGILTKNQANFWEQVYTNGLGEFFYKNKIDFRDLVHFPSGEISTTPIEFSRTNRSLVGVGGGKDSLVSVELLKKGQKQFTGYVIETKRSYEVVEEVSKVAGIELMRVKRMMDPKIDEYNQLLDTYNGHIPVSAMYALTGILIAVLYDYRYVITSNERSASYGNVEYLGKIINHQWSKSLEFEQLFKQFTRENITPDVEYFSLLRPFYELGIVSEFVKSPQYFKHFSSCNKQYKLSAKANKLWCGDCPKCAFVYLLMSAYISRSELIAIFGQDLFNQDSLLETYKELIGITGIKPFECVGTPEESQVAFYMAYEKGEYKDSLAMDMFVNDCLPKIHDINKLKASVLHKYESANIPQEFQHLVYEN